MSEVIDKNAFSFICHTGTDDARYYIPKANRATCEEASRRLEALTREDGCSRKTIRKMLDVRLRKLAKEERRAAK